jgi:glycosyltransferase involved in cell wall biosynthesis
VTRPRVLLAVHVYPDGGGIAAIVENTVQLLEERFEVHLAVVEPRTGLLDHLALPTDRVHVHGYSNLMNPLLMPASLLYPALVGRFLRRLVKELRPVALLVQDGLNLPVPAAIAAVRTSTRLAVMDHGTLSNTCDREWRAIVRRRLSGLKRLAFTVGFALDAPWRALRWRLGLRFADAAWFVGEELAPLFARAGSKAKRYKQVLPLDFEPPSRRARGQARRALDVEGVATVVNMVTRLDGEKGLDHVVAALGRIAASEGELAVLVVGDGTLESAFRRELEHEGIGSTVRLLGRRGRREILEVQHASDFHLYAGTIGSGVSIALLEAMCCGVIPLVSDTPRAHRQLVGDAGIVFETGSTDAVEVALRSALAKGQSVRDCLRGQVVEAVANYAEPSLASLVRELVSDEPEDARSSVGKTRRRPRARTDSASLR